MSLHKAALAAATALGLASGAAAEPMGDMRMTFNGSVMGLRVMKAEIHASLAAGSYEASSVFRSAGIAGFVKESRVESSGAGARGGGGLAPSAYRHLEIAGKKRRTVEFAFAPGDVTAKVEPPFSTMGEPPPTPAQRREAVDPLAMLLALALPGGAAPCARTLKVFDSKQRYDLVLTPVAVEKVKTRAYKGEAHKCLARYVPVAGFDPDDLAEPEAYQAPIHIWLAKREDGFAAPVLVRTRLPLGPLKLDVAIEADTLALAES